MEQAAGNAELFGGRYTIGRGLGQGPVGIVAEAVRAEDGKKVALKCLGPRFVADQTAATRFARAVGIAGKLKSVHAARVYDAGSPDLPYAATELFTTPSIAKLVADRGPLTLSGAVRYAVQACTALAEAHGMGFSHGNLNLENWFIVQEAGAPTLKLTDFGIAETRLMGTPDAGPRSDVRGVGIALHVMLTGKFPGQADLPEGAEALGPIIDRCVDADPGNRYATVTELSYAVSRAVKTVDSIAPMALDNDDEGEASTTQASEVEQADSPTPFRQAGSERAAGRFLGAMTVAAFAAIITLAAMASVDPKPVVAAGAAVAREARQTVNARLSLTRAASGVATGTEWLAPKREKSSPRRARPIPDVGY